MAKTHEGDCVDIDPFLPTGTCVYETEDLVETLPPELRTDATRKARQDAKELRAANGIATSKPPRIKGM